ncbi:MAG: diaminopimelate epimerase, partial [Fimbriimonadaceae bacterium]|nr:diaminopimelate epimerase [Fimbriimonadaceae bacterium]
MKIPFAKLESIGNDFVLLQAADLDCHTDLSILAQQLCERRFGIGSDGLLIVGNDEEGWWLRMFNPDGSEDFCGNGLRCAAWWVHHRMGAPDEFLFWHRGLQVSVWVKGDGEVYTELPAPSYAPEEVPHRLLEPIIDQTVEDVLGSALTTGSTHFVSFVDQLPDDELFCSLSPKVENASIFPERTSVIWAKSEADGLELRIWERGIGETLGCGTGATAAAVDFVRRRGQGGEITVRSRGGALRIQVDATDKPVRVIGLPEFVFE